MIRRKMPETPSFLTKQGWRCQFIGALPKVLLERFVTAHPKGLRPFMSLCLRFFQASPGFLLGLKLQVTHSQCVDGFLSKAHLDLHHRGLIRLRFYRFKF